MKYRPLTSLLTGFAAVLLLSGALLAGFVAFLIYGTGIETRLEQRRLLDELEFVTVADLPSPAGRTVPALSYLFEQRPVANIGEPIGQLSIPKIDAEWVFVSGVGANELRLGPGHFPDSSMPGEQGNAAIAGHRTSHGSPFSRIDEINPGDEIILTTSSGIHRYTSVGTAIVGPADHAEISTQWPTVPTLSLVSCHPKYSTRQRIVVHAVLEGHELPAVSQSMPSTNQAMTTSGTAEQPDGSGSLTSESSSAANQTDAPSVFDGTEGVAETQSSPIVWTKETVAWLKGPINPSGTIPATILWTKASSSSSTSSETRATDPFSDYQFSPSSVLSVMLFGLTFSALIAVTFGVMTGQRRRYLFATPVTICSSVVALYLFYSAVHDILPAGV
ncbi:MAG TPA: hypothetical protein DEB38_02125 [Acidimicrobiaceae bacterium]|nr:hypothetical protein [Acidimicrobiaceae bacterium]